jgi:hypothetical protein
MHPTLFPTLFRRPVFVCAVLLLGCAAAAPHSRRNLTPATTQSSAPRTLRFADAAVSVDHFRDDDHDIDLRNVIHFEKDRDVYFGQSERYDADGNAVATVPLIVAGKKGAWLALSVADPRLPNAEWQFVASGPREGEMWGVLDDTLTGRAKIILLAHSLDAGVTWTLSQVIKPFEAGEYDSFAMDKSGRGRLTVYIAPTKNYPRRAGFYHFRTTDAGQTWSPPDHEPDALDPADDVSPDEEPEPLQSTPTQTARVPGVISPIDSTRLPPHPNPLPQGERELE